MVELVSLRQLMCTLRVLLERSLALFQWFHGMNKLCTASRSKRVRLDDGDLSRKHVHLGNSDTRPEMPSPGDGGAFSWCVDDHCDSEDGQASVKP
jgi:hypothetical protein